MAEQKIFAGPRIRRIRNQKGLTQTAMAEGLGISPSYLNLIERNQRPVTAQLLLRLAETYDLDLRDLASAGPVFIVPIPPWVVTKIGEAAYQPGTIPGDTYKGQGAAVPSVAVQNFLVSH